MTTINQWNDVDSIARIAAIFISGITIYFWLSKRVISYKTAKWLIIVTSLLTGIPVGIGFGWLFSLFVTLLQTSVLYFVVEIANKETKEKQQGKKINTTDKDRIL